jgi:hypothetical protein
MKQFLTLIAVAAFSLTAFAQDSTIKTVSVYSYAGAPVNGTNEIDTITIRQARLRERSRSPWPAAELPRRSPGAPPTLP